MADEMLKNSRATSGNSGDHPDNSSDSDSVQNGQPTEKEVDEVLFDVVFVEHGLYIF